MTITTIAPEADLRREVRRRVVPHEPAHRADSGGPPMQLIIVRHGETDWTLDGRYTGSTEVDLTDNGRHQAALLALLLQRVLHGRRAMLVSSPRRRATETAALALPEHNVIVDPLVAEYGYGEFEGLTGEQIRQLAPGWDIWRDGCPNGESPPTSADAPTRSCTPAWVRRAGRSSWSPTGTSLESWPPGPCGCRRSRGGCWPAQPPRSR